MQNQSQSSDSPVYTKIQCIGMCICTTPGDLTTIEDMSDEGRYLGDPNAGDDISRRLQFIRTAVEKAAEQADTDKATLKVFVVPEFYFRGDHGAYFDPNEILTNKYMALCQNIFKDYPHWLFVLGSFLTAKAKVDPTVEPTQSLYNTGDSLLDVYHKLHPPTKAVATAGERTGLRTLLKALDEELAPSADCLAASPDASFQDVLRRTLDYCDGKAGIEISNYSYNFYCHGHGDVRVRRVLKMYKSKEDFILNSIDGNYTQTITKYKQFPTGNEIKKNDLDDYAIFQVGNIWIGLDICLDHSRRRLFEHLTNHTDNYVDLQIVTSCGMDVRPTAVIARTGGHVFNCDGEYIINGRAINGEHSHTALQNVQTQINPKKEEPGSQPPEAMLYPAQQCKKVVQLKASKEFYPYENYHVHVYSPMPIKVKAD